MKIILRILTTLFVLKSLKCAPVDHKSRERKGKSLAFLDYLQPEIDYNNYEVDNDDYVSMALEENDLSRSIPTNKRIRPQPYNSPIYYIRMPPQPYMFVPGLGYVSQPPPSPMSQFVNVPVSFVANGKPSSIYQWSGAFQGFPDVTPPPFPVPKPQKPAKKPLSDSIIHRLPGTFTFNGKPEDIFVLRDSYNSLYSDVLQNVYP
ncbi:hypothetical protein NQ314_014676 [Rhamnusium bicolor]|uniref:Uncharacterized protein n=1 Tax=Rhamnusium bicolor TaxID=1586634 RepID=A0AAV8X0V9_9CUCU|nr:hypothetical protein NQ314_014676 [Rhamnusium bicolor]